MPRPRAPHTEYRPVALLARGGMGTVELVVRSHESFRRLFALKRPFPHLFAEPKARQMFTNEARLAGLIHHPNVVPVVDFGEDEAGPYLVMEYVDGASLAALIAAAGARGEGLPLGVALTIAAQIARGLHAAHELRGADGTPLGLVHRDVNPRNVLVGVDGLARVTDFGIAKALGVTSETATGIVRGSVGYLAPECLRFEAFDRRADLFALGVLLFEALTGARLYEGDDAAAIAGRVLRDPPPDLFEHRADSPPELVELSFELLAKDPDARPPNALVVAERIETLLADARGQLGRVDVGGYLKDTCGEALGERARLVAAALEGDRAQIRRRQRRRVGKRAAMAVAAAAAIAVPIAAAVRALQPAPPAPAHGLRGAYYDDIDFRALVMTRIDPEVKFDWTDGAPDPRIYPGTYSVRWTGHLLADADGPHRLCVRSDDRARLRVEGRLLVDDWRDHATRLTCGEITLQAGHAYALDLEFVQTWREAIIELAWARGAADEPTTVPAERLLPPRD